MDPPFRTRKCCECERFVDIGNPERPNIAPCNQCRRNVCMPCMGPHQLNCRPRRRLQQALIGTEEEELSELIEEEKELPGGAVSVLLDPALSLRPSAVTVEQDPMEGEKETPARVTADPLESARSLRPSAETTDQGEHPMAEFMRGAIAEPNGQCYSLTENGARMAPGLLGLSGFTLSKEGNQWRVTPESIDGDREALDLSWVGPRIESAGWDVELRGEEAWYFSRHDEDILELHRTGDLLVSCAQIREVHEIAQRFVAQWLEEPEEFSCTSNSEASESNEGSST